MKRFAETIDRDDVALRKLSPKAKHLRRYLWDNCDCCGVISLDLETISYWVGERIDEKHVAELGNWLERLPNGRFLIPSFIHFQCGQLTSTCRGHTSVIKTVAKHALVPHGILYHHSSHSLSENVTPVSESSEKTTGVVQEKEMEQDRTGGGVQRGKAPSLEEIKLQAAKAGLPDSEAVKFHAFYESNGWRVGKNPMRSWHAAMTNWKMNYEQRTFQNNGAIGAQRTRQLTGAEHRQIGIGPVNNGVPIGALLAANEERQDAARKRMAEEKAKP